MSITPQQRCARFGVTHLSDTELLTIILGARDPRTSWTMLGNAGSLTQLSRLTARALSQQPDVSRTQATRLLAALEAGRRSLRDDAHRPEVRSASDAFSILAPELGGRPQESLWALYLDRQQRLIAQRRLTTGNDENTIVDPRLVLQPALLLGATSIIISHNHPCGDPQPSTADLRATRQLCDAAKLLGLELLDHIIFGAGCYVSLAECGAVRPGWTH